MDSHSELTRHLREAGVNLVEIGNQAPCSRQSTVPNGQLRHSVDQAFDEPLEFPPLAQCTVPGDQVAIAVDEAVPRVEEVVAGVIDAFERAGVEADEIRVVTADSRCANRLKKELPALGRDRSQVVLHDPARDTDLCFVGAMPDGQALLANRTLFEADVVFPIGCTRLEGVLGTTGLYDSLYPRFSDAATIGRWQMVAAADQAQCEQWRRNTEMAGWLLGAAMVLEVVPALHGEVAQIIAGEARAVARDACSASRHQWSWRAPQSASLAIVTLDDGRQRQPWTEVARAIDAAENVLQDHGSLVICCAELDPPGKSLRRLEGVEDPGEILPQLMRDAESDTWFAWQLVRARLRGPVYLWGGLDEEASEELGLAPIRDITELTRLAGRHESCIVLEDSHHVVATAED